MSAIAQPTTRVARERSARVRGRRSWVLSGGVVWIVVFAALLAGVVAINVAVLRLNLQLDQSNRDQTQLKTDIAGLRAEISSAAAATRIERLAKGELGLVEVQPEDTTYIQLGK
jgi:cell division protein FtsL